jgi:hypothetical protein
MAMIPELHKVRTRSLGRSVELFPDRHEAFFAANDQAPVAEGNSCLKSNYRKGRLRAECRQKLLERLGADVGAITKHNEDCTGEAVERAARHQHRVAGTAPLMLIGGDGARQVAFDLAIDAPIRGSLDHNRPFGFELCYGGEHVTDQRASGGDMHDLGQRRAHARAKPRGQNDDSQIRQARAPNH